MKVNNGAAYCISNLLIKTTAINMAARQAVKKWAGDVKTTSQNTYCPVDTGALKNSAKDEVVINTLTNFYVRISYGAGLDYAVYVHEIPNMHKHGQWKYLSTPFHQMSSRLLSDIKTAGSAVI